MDQKDNFLLLPSFAGTILKFRGNLIKEVSREYKVFVAGPKISSSMQAEFNKRNIEHIHLPIVNISITPFRDISYFMKLVAIIIKLRPKIILSYTLKPNLYGSLAARIFRVDCYSMFTGLGSYFEKKEGIFNRVSLKLLKFILRTSLKRNKKVIFYNSNNMETFMISSLCSPSQAEIVEGSGVDINYYKSKRFRDFTNIDNIVFLCSSRILKDKGIMEYLEAAKEIKSKNKGVDFRLMGWFQESSNSVSKEIIEKYSQEGIIKFIGHVEDVREEIDSCDVFVLPSYHEGLPRSALEAMSMSKAVILSKIPGTSNLIKENNNGFFCEPKSTESLVDSIEKMLKHRTRIREFGSESRTIIEERFSDKLINRKLLELLRIPL